MNPSDMIQLVIDKLQTWLELAIQLLPNLVLAIVVMVIFGLAARVARRVLANVLGTYSDNLAVNRILTNIVYIAIIAFGLFTALGILNLNKTVTSLLAGAGVIGLALGFAFQEIASNFIAGIFIAFRKPYKIDDIVEISNFVGTVSSIDLRTTSIITFQGLEVMVPNKTMFTEPFINYTTTPRRRIDLKVGVSYGDDLEKVLKVSKEALENVPDRIRDEDIGIWFEEFGASSINFVAQIWIQYPGDNSFLKARSAAVMNLKKAFDENGITIPFPIRTLDFGIKGGERLAETLGANSGNRGSSKQGQSDSGVDSNSASRKGKTDAVDDDGD